VSAFPNATGEPGHPMNAKYWNDQAIQAGYDVGNIPVKGAIVVFEAGSKYAAGDAGHVGYVESVVPVEGGYKMVFSQASTIYTSNSWIRGDHKMLKPLEIFIPATGSGSDMSFIYDKRP
ncbi:MAG: CHAP domain-containing protein, partial [Anaerolineaceae bacterium]